MAITISLPTIGGNEDTWGSTINTGLTAIQNTLNGSGTGKVTVSSGNAGAGPSGSVLISSGSSTGGSSGNIVISVGTSEGNGGDVKMKSNLQSRMMDLDYQLKKEKKFLLEGLD